MTRLLLLCAAAALSGCSVWQPAEQRAFAFSMACQAVDLMQTDAALENGMHEANPLLGSHPSDGKLVAAKVVAVAGTFYLAEAVNPENRVTAILLATVPCLYVVAHNYSIGARP